MDRKDRIGLARGALMLQRSYHQVMRLVMVGAIKGGQDEHGRWWADAEDVARFERDQRAKGPTPHGAAA